MNEQNEQKDKKKVVKKQGKGTKHKPRSPRYPCISLREAVRNAQALYDTNGKAFVPKEVAVKAWGYNRLHGRSLTVLAAMTQYGLLNSQIGEVGISDGAFIIIEAPRNSPERKMALESCAKLPTIFNELYQSYPQGLPGDEALKWALKQRGFTEDGAQTTIGCFRDTNMFVEEELRDYTGGNEVKEEITEHKELPPMQSIAQHIVRPATPVGAEPWIIPLLNKKAVVSIVGEEPPVQEDVDLLIKMLENFKLGLHSKKAKENTDNQENK
jgi:hypothetical protein